jgi:hypothetical protein
VDENLPFVDCRQCSLSQCEVGGTGDAVGSRAQPHLSIFRFVHDVLSVFGCCRVDGVRPASTMDGAVRSAEISIGARSVSLTRAFRSKYTRVPRLLAAMLERQFRVVALGMLISAAVR